MNPLKFKNCLILILSFLLVVTTPGLSFAEQNNASSQVGLQQDDQGEGFWEKNKGLIQGIVIMLMAIILERFLGGVEEGEIPEEIPLPPEPSPQEDKDTPDLEVRIKGFYTNWEDDGNSLSKSAPYLSSLSPFWYSLNNDGTVSKKQGGHDEGVHKFSKEQDLLILPLLNNHSENSDFLETQESRQTAAQNVLDLLIHRNYDGINVNLERLPPWQRDNYTDFIKDLSRLLRPRGYELAISVFPKVDFPYELHHVYDYRSLAPYIDSMVIMTYDYHWPGGSPGPIAPLDWVRKNIEYALQFVPARKIILGAANYGYDWPSSGRGTTIPAKNALNLAREREAEIIWDSQAHSHYFHYWSNGEKHTVWFEDSQSFQYKKELALEYNLSGLAIWQLGNEEEHFWNILE